MIILEDPHALVLDAQDKIFPHRGMGDNIAVALKTDGAVFVDLAVDPPEGIECPRRQRLQMGPLSLESLRHHFVGCPMNPPVFELEPLE